MKIKKQFIYLFITVLVVALAACGPMRNPIPVTGGTEAANTPSNTSDQLPQAVLDAQQWLAEQLSVVAENVRLVSFEHVEWTDSCLGLGQANESCLRAATPGWRVVFEINGQSYEVRTDENASSIRLKP